VLENFDWATGTWPSLTGLKVYNIPVVRGPDTLRIVCIISRTVYFYTIETSRAVAQAGSSVRQIPDESNILLCSSSIYLKGNMGFAAKQFGSRVANPQSVLNHIGSLPVDLSEDAPAAHLEAQTAPVELKIFQPEEPSLDAEHTRQLGQHLIRTLTISRSVGANSKKLSSKTFPFATRRSSSVSGKCGLWRANCCSCKTT